MTYRQLIKTDFQKWSVLIQELWPMNGTKLNNEFAELFSKQTGICTFNGDNLVGVVHVAIRTDYVAGTSTSPVGYIEGIVVTKSMRKQGIASELLNQAALFAKSKGCSEMGSDIEIDNLESLEFHIKNGYIEQERVVALSKKI